MIRKSALIAAGLLLGGTLLAAPAASAVPFADWKTVDPGSQHTCGIRGTGLLYCWGRNNVGQIGDGVQGDENNRDVPKRITAVADWKVVTGGSSHTCGIRGTGALYCWGDNSSGQIGNGTVANEWPSPRRITLVSDWKSVSGGFIHTCGIRGTGALYCWGNNTYGQLGDGTDDSHLTPKRVGTLSDWKSVSAGGNHTCGIRSTGVLYCWGDGAAGEIGDGGSGMGANRPSPTKITAVVDWRRVSAGAEHTCGVRGTGALYCWGYNTYGQIGDGTTGTNRVTPKRIGTFANWTSLGIGGHTSCGIQGSGTLNCWGANNFGQVGDGTSGNDNNQLTPKKITAVVDWKVTSTGGSHTCGIRGTGALYCWGFNFEGQVGNGTSNNGIFSPVRI